MPKKHMEGQYDLNAYRIPEARKVREPSATYGSSLSMTKPKSVDEAIQSIKTGVQQYLQSDKWKEILITFGRFHQYSLNNSLMIMMQNPVATQVASFTTWKSLGRYPLKGSHGMKIICPAPYKHKEKQEVTDEETGEKRQEEVEVRRIAFTLGTVFDVSQTGGKPLPEITSELQGDVADKDLLEAVKRSVPDDISVVIGPVDGSAKGYFNFAEREIRIKEGQSEQQSLKTLCHETAHATVHDPETNPDAKKVSTQDKEIQAESVAYIICQHYGIDTSDYSFPYISAWAGDTEKLMPNLEVIKKTSSELIRRIDQNLEQIRNEKQTEGAYKTEYGYLDLQKQEDGTWNYRAYNKSLQRIYSGKTEQKGIRIDQVARQINMVHGYVGANQPIDRTKLLIRSNTEQLQAKRHSMTM